MLSTRRLTLLTLIAAVGLGLAALLAAPASAGRDAGLGAAAPPAPAGPAPAGPALAGTTSLPIVDDFEGGLPPGFVGFADSWDGSGSATTLAYETTLVDLPVVPPITSSTAVSVSYFIAASGSWGGGPGYGGVTRDFAATQDWDGYEGFSFWWYSDGSGGAHRVELKADGGDAFNSNRYEFTFVDDVAGWRFFDLPFADFVPRTDFNPGPSPSDPLNLSAVWGYSILLAPGAGGQFYLDQVALTKRLLVHDFDAGIPSGFVGFADSWDGSGSATTLAYGPTTVDLPVVPPLTNTGAVSATYFIAASGSWGGGPGYGGVTFDYGAATDWSDYTRFALWWYSDGSGAAHRVELKADGPAPANSNRYEYTFVDDVVGWRLFDIPFDVFVPRTDFNPGPSPNDPINLNAIWGYSILLAPGAAGTFNMDEVALYGQPTELKVSFAAGEADAVEGETVTLTVALNNTPATTVTVDYANTGGTAAPGADFTPLAGTLTFAPGNTSQTIVVATLEDTDPESAETIEISLSNPVSATLGATTVAVVTIVDNDAASGGAKADLVDDWEDGALPTGTDPNGIDIGFITWSDGSPVAIMTTTVATAGIDPLPGGDDANIVLQFDANIGSWGGFSHAFENADVTEWISQNWSAYEGFSFWLYGTGSGTTLFIDLIENRNPGSTTDDAERWTYSFDDDFLGWKQVNIPFADFARKDIGNGAPNDGLTLTEVHGWALGSLNTGGVLETHYVDNVGLLVRVDIVDDWEDGALPTGTDPNGIDIGFITWSDGSPVAIMTKTVATAGIDPLPGGDDANIVLQFDANIGSWGGFSHAFENADVTEWISQDWSTYEGFCFWLYGTGSGTTLFIDLLENRNPGSTTDDAERWTYSLDDDFVGWRLITIPFADFARKDIGNGAPNDGLTLTEVHGWALGSLNTGGVLETHYVDQVAIYGNTGGAVQELTAAYATLNYEVTEGATAAITITLNMTSTEPVTVTYATVESNGTPGEDFTPTSGALVFAPGETVAAFDVVTLDDAKAEGEEKIVLNLTGAENAALAFQRLAVLAIADDDAADPALLDDFEGFHRFAQQSGNLVLYTTVIPAGDPLERPGQGAFEGVANATYSGPVSFERLFSTPEDWSANGGLTFWFYGVASGDTVTVELLDNQVATTGDVDPTDWTLIWSDEFDDPAGTPPNPNIWGHELGDGTLNGIPGWGNAELQYYTDSTDNAATDGAGNLVITTRAVNTATSTLLCAYGPCEYTSARLLTKNRHDFQYGRIEARILVPSGGDGIPDGNGYDLGDGLWPAFWSLGSDIDEVEWPQTGEIDIMEVVSREPYDVFGTIHGPGYSGGLSFGDTYVFAEPVSEAFHTFAIEWQPEQIRWYVDGILYHTAAPGDVAPNEWVFEHPFFILLNQAVGGNFGGAVGDNTGFPQEMVIDYVRVYGAENASERFEASFVDDAVGWRQITLPFADMTRSADQPAGAPDDGLTLTEVWGYGFTIDQVGPLAPNGGGTTILLDAVTLAPDAPTSVALSSLGETTNALPALLALALVAVLGLAAWRRRTA